MATVENRSKGSRARFYDPLPARNWLLSVAALMGSFIRLVCSPALCSCEGILRGSNSALAIHCQMCLPVSTLTMRSRSPTASQARLRLESDNGVSTPASASSATALLTAALVRPVAAVATATVTTG